MNLKKLEWDLLVRRLTKLRNKRKIGDGYAAMALLRLHLDAVREGLIEDHVAVSESGWMKVPIPLLKAVVDGWAAAIEKEGADLNETFGKKGREEHSDHHRWVQSATDYRRALRVEIMMRFEGVSQAEAVRRISVDNEINGVAGREGTLRNTHRRLRDEVRADLDDGLKAYANEKQDLTGTL